MLEFIKKWFSFGKDDEFASDKGDKPYFNRVYSFGIRGGEDEADIYLIDPVKRVKYPIVDKAGNFINFPGIENEGLLKPYYKGDIIAPIICFRTDFFRDEDNDKLVVHWQVQPDGRYWADDDGFGADNDYEIILYSFITEDGKFESPFHIYKIGNVKYYGTDLEEQEKQEYEKWQEEERKRVELGESVDDTIRRYIDMAAERFIEMASSAEKDFAVCFNVPDSYYEAMLRLVSIKPDWSLYIDVKIRGTDRLFSHIYSKGEEGSMRSREWIIEELKKPEARETIFNSVKRLCERIDRD